MIDLLAMCAFNAAYAEAIDSDALEQWPAFFMRRLPLPDHARGERARRACRPGIVWADSRAMLEDRDSRAARSEHLRAAALPPSARAAADRNGRCPLRHRARRRSSSRESWHTGESDLFATGVYRDRFVSLDGRLLLAERVAVCDSTVTDTLLALPL